MQRLGQRPIARAVEVDRIGLVGRLAQQFRERIHSLNRFAKGSMVFMSGFCVKVLLADPVAPLADAAWKETRVLLRSAPNVLPLRPRAA